MDTEPEKKYIQVKDGLEGCCDSCVAFRDVVLCGKLACTENGGAGSLSSRVGCRWNHVWKEVKDACIQS